MTLALFWGDCTSPRVLRTPQRKVSKLGEHTQRNLNQNADHDPVQNIWNHFLYVILYKYTGCPKCRHLFLKLHVLKHRNFLHKLNRYFTQAKTIGHMSYNSMHLHVCTPSVNCCISVNCSTRNRLVLFASPFFHLNHYFLLIQALKYQKALLWYYQNPFKI